MSEKEELVKQYFTKSDIKPKAIEENALEILKMRYFSVKADGNKEENFSELCRRVARTMASAEILYYNDIDSIKNVENSIYKDMMEHKFLFNSPALFSSGAGQSLSKKYSEKLYKDINQMTFDDYKYLYDYKSKNQMLFACFVIGVPDSLEGIFDSVKNAAIISKYGGGVGANFSCLREKTADISGGTGGKASGPISFMETWNTMGSVVVQGGKRRAALMGMLNSNHPDIEDFINSKTEDGKLQYFNISVAIDNQFMDAVINDKEYDLISPQDNKVVKTVKARELWDKICNNAHKRGDPGIFFVDLANHDSLLQGLGDYIIHSTNPCLAGDTLVAVADGRNSVSIKQLAEENKDIPVYCIDDSGNLDIKIMRNPRITGYDKDIYEILLDDGSKIKATSNHKFRLYNGSYKEVSELVHGDSLWISEKRKLAFYENFYDENFDSDAKKYWYLSTKNGKVAEHHLIHNFYNNKNIYDKIEKGYNIHHLDEDQFNNKIENLLLCTASDHHKIYHDISGENNPINKYPECNWRNNPTAQQKMREKYHIGAKRSEETKLNIGAATKDRFINDEEFRIKHSEAIKAAMINEVKQKISNNKKEYYHSIVNEKLVKCQAQTDLKCIIVGNSIYVEKNCEICGKLFIVPFGRREISICSSICNGEKISKRLLGSTISEKTREVLNNKKENLKEAQIKVYSDLKFELGKDPMKKEWFDKCKELGISAEIARKSSPFRKYNDLKVAAMSYNHKVVRVTYVGKETVYNGTVDDHHNFCIVLPTSIENCLNIVNSQQCGEQPLSNDTSCNLGSINLVEFVTNGTFDYSLFRDMVARSIYYLDLVIDATCYPLDIIEKKTKAIRPVGLGVMGLADTAILLGLKYGSKEFFEFSKTIASIMAGESLYMTYLIGSKLKEPFEMWNATTDMSGEDNAKDLIQSYACTTEEIKEYSECIDLLNIFIERTDKSVAKSDKLWTLKNALEYLVNLTYNEKFEVEDLVALFNCLFYVDSKSGLRNSRRLSIAPTGTISLILNTSSSIEPNFAYEWDRLVTINEKEKRTLKYYHRYNNEENKNKGLLISAHEVTPLEHVKVVKCFAPYIDSAISKTVNLPFEATVDQVKEVYEECYTNKIKGITIYRDGSRSEQPLQKKEEKKEEVKTVINEEPITVKTVVKIKDRPQFMAGVTTKSDSPFGSIYVTSNFDNDGMPFEIFVSAGKSGSISKSITEALSRVISLALRAGVNIDDIIKTMNNISGSEAWVYDSLDGKELIVRSIPDAISKMLKDLIDYHKLEGIEIKKLPVKKEDYNSHEVLCPECGNQMVMISGCSCCSSCGFSPCK